MLKYVLQSREGGLGNTSPSRGGEGNKKQERSETNPRPRFRSMTYVVFGGILGRDVDKHQVGPPVEERAEVGLQVKGHHRLVLPLRVLPSKRVCRWGNAIVAAQGSD